MNDIEQKQKIQYILDENGKLKEMLKEDAIPVENPIKYKLKNAFEVFLQVPNSDNYWISNYGRCVNNYNRKDKNTFYEHKCGNVHYTIHWEDKRGDVWKRDIFCDYLVAEVFLVQYKYRKRVWHKDGDKSNNYYKNLIYVSNEDLNMLRKGKVTWDSLGMEQEYIEYENKASYQARHIYNSIRTRCKYTKEDKRMGKCYDEATMCQEWLDNPTSFVKWYLNNYYEVDNESMAVDKDLFGNGSKVYSPENCCILPQGLNTLLSNCKRHYRDGQTEKNVLPMGVGKNGKNGKNKSGKYRGEITLASTGEFIKLSEWDTPEQAFEEYKVIKKADIRVVAAQYKSKVPDRIYKHLLEVDVEPY